MGGCYGRLLWACTGGRKISSIADTPLHKFAVPSFIESLPEDVKRYQVVVYAGYAL